MYCNQQDLITRFSEIEVSDLLSIHTEDSLKSVQTAINDATSLINSYLSTRGYSLPVPKSEHLTAVCSDIVRYKLYSNDATEQVTLRYQEALAWLRDVAKGKADVPFADSQITEETNSRKAAAGKSYTGGTFSDSIFSKMP